MPDFKTIADFRRDSGPASHRCRATPASEIMSSHDLGRLCSVVGQGGLFFGCRRLGMPAFSARSFGARTSIYHSPERIEKNQPWLDRDSFHNSSAMGSGSTPTAAHHKASSP
jgi:hypothetical protein